MNKPMFEVAVIEHGGANNRPVIRLRFRMQDHTIPPVDFYVEGDETQAGRLEQMLTEVRGSELDPGTVVQRISRDYDFNECAMRIYAGNYARNPDSYFSPAVAFNAAEAFIAELKRREEET